MTVRLMPTLILVGTVLGCTGRFEAERVRKAADGFWAANMAGEIGVAKRYVLDGSTATLTRPEDGRPPFQNYSLGEVDVDGNRATVETLIVGANGNRGVEMEFKTSLVLSGNIWWIDLDRTTGEIMQTMMGINTDQLGAAMAAAMSQAMEGVATEMQASLEQTARQMDARAGQAGSRR